ncbi:MAG: hypothetical protein JW809_06310 [Pirellulales bacterium]|nr:hypothetical protein [Pirellulales bacterium]
MTPRSRRAFSFVLASLTLLASAARLPAAAPATFSPQREGLGELRLIDDVPVLLVRGSPEDVGRQTALLVGPQTKRVLDYPRDTLASGPDGDATWSWLVQAARQLRPNVPADHLAELDALAHAAQIDPDRLLVGNVMMDVYRGLGCSSLLIEPARSKTGQTLFGRNLDFPSAGYLHRYSLVTVCRPRGKRAFASVGFPGLVGCLSGMNDAGLALAVHEVLVSRDGSRLYNPKGVPYTFAFRRILEECATVEEAEKLLVSIERTTMYNLAVCDRRRAGVLEVTPRSVVLRPAEDGLCACTNHFRAAPLAIFPFCDRYAKLSAAASEPTLGVADVAAKLDAANLGDLTLQTMIFEPAPLRLHLAFGRLPASSGPLRVLDLAPLLTTPSCHGRIENTP